jgi:hypothetical protein
MDFEIGSVLYGYGVYAPSLKIGDNNNQSASGLFGPSALGKATGSRKRDEYLPW